MLLLTQFIEHVAQSGAQLPNTCQYVKQHTELDRELDTRPNATQGAFTGKPPAQQNI